MKKTLTAKKKLDLTEAQRVVAMREVAHELEATKRDVAAHLESGETAPVAGEELPIDSIVGLGQSPEGAFAQVITMFSEFLNTLGNFVFSVEHRERFYPERKVTYLVGVLKGAGYTMEAAGAMDIFKDRVKKLHSGKMPKITEKKGLFSKTVTRPMTVGEIAKNFEIEEDLPADELKGLTGYPGTQRGLLQYVRKSLLEDDEIRDPFKRAPRKQLATFLKGVGLLDPASMEREEKQVVACLLTPDAYQPRSREDTECLLRFRALLKRATEALKRRIEAEEEAAKAAEQEEEQEQEKKKK